MLQVWDLRKTKEALKVFDELPNHYGQTNIGFSPDEQLFFTGTSVERDSSTGGLLCFFDRENLELVSKVGISPTCSVVRCFWHPKLNQVTNYQLCYSKNFWYHLAFSEAGFVAHAYNHLELLFMLKDICHCW